MANNNLPTFTQNALINILFPFFAFCASLFTRQRQRCCLCELKGHRFESMPSFICTERREAFVLRAFFISRIMWASGEIPVSGILSVAGSLIYCSSNSTGETVCGGPKLSCHKATRPSRTFTLLMPGLGQKECLRSGEKVFGDSWSNNGLEVGLLSGLLERTIYSARGPFLFADETTSILYSKF